MDLINKKVAVIGLGIEGCDLVNYLVKVGAVVTIHDIRSEVEIDKPNIPREVSFITGEDYLQDLDKYDYVFRSPGIYPMKSELNSIRESNKLSSAVKLFFKKCPARIIGVTGTKGKGTTSSILYEILKEDGKDVYLAGNIGKPYLELLPKLTKDSWVILELSSFQLMDLTQSPHVSVVLNITTDHLDWHRDRDEYVEAKKSIVKYQKPADFKVINADYNDSNSFADLGDGKPFFFSRSNKLKGCFVNDGRIILNIDGGEVEIGQTKDLLLRGEHNWENTTAAITAASLVGASIQSIKQAVFSFKGLEHRLELVGEVDTIKFYNDSFATGPDTVLAAANSFTEPTTLILGGFDKGLDYANMASELSRKKDTNIILIGDIADQIEKDLENAQFKGVIKSIGKPSMKEIVNKAIEITPKGGVILLSPGTSSFDMFESYKERGNQFRKVVHNINASI